MLSLKATCNTQKDKWTDKRINTYVKYIKIHSNCSPWLGENLAIYKSQMAKNTFKLSTMVREIFEID